MSADPARLFFPSCARSGIGSDMNQGSGIGAAEESLQLARLLAAIARSERDALAQLYVRTSAKLYGICLRILGSEAEAQEVLQEAYVTVWSRAETFDPGRAGAIAWLAVLARNKAIDRLRLRRVPTERIEAADAIADQSPSALDLLEEAEDRERLARCIDDLEEKQREAIRAAFLEGASYPELSEREGVPLGTMKSWIRRALISLRTCLEP
jgi:RNA polymerase sigma factor (sigma-70 family)